MGCDTRVGEVDYGHGRRSGRRSVVCHAYAVDAGCATRTDQLNLGSEIGFEARPRRERRRAARGRPGGSRFGFAARGSPEPIS